MSTWQSRRLVHPKTADQYFSKQCQKAETAPEFSWKLVPTTPLLVACNRCANSQSASPILSFSLCWAAPERRSFNYAIFYFRRNLQLKWASSPGQANARQTARPPTCLGSSYIVHLYVSMSMHLFFTFLIKFLLSQSDCNSLVCAADPTDSASAYNCCCYTASVATCAP